MQASNEILRYLDNTDDGSQPDSAADTVPENTDVDPDPISEVFSPLDEVGVSLNLDESTSKEPIGL